MYHYLLSISLIDLPIPIRSPYHATCSVTLLTSAYTPYLVELIVDPLDARKEGLPRQHLNEDAAHSPKTNTQTHTNIIAMGEKSDIHISKSDLLKKGFSGSLGKGHQ